MKNLALLVVTVFVPLFGSTVSAQDASAVNVQTSCAHWEKLRLDKHKQFKGGSDDLYETGLCLGYFDGLMDGMDNTGGWQHSDGSVGVFEIKRSAIASKWDVIRAFYAYVDATPLAKGKPAWSVLQSVLTANGLATFVPQETHPQPSVLNDECKTGANNVISQFNSDSDLKAIDTATLVSVSSKLRECLNTKGLTDADSVLLLFAQNQANLVLLDRAVNVLDRHALLPELRAERSTSTRNTTASHIPSGTGTEQ
ncbi:MAG: hypothetical protein WCD47_24175 [Candidatus Sulfotelmatobacter sp.]|jgi:hypothetical protein